MDVFRAQPPENSLSRSGLKLRAIDMYRCLSAFADMKRTSVVNNGKS
jgi:hypothetical protein